MILTRKIDTTHESMCIYCSSSTEVELATLHSDLLIQLPPEPYLRIFTFSIATDFMECNDEDEDRVDRGFMLT